jgi:hypothetical protein
VLTVAGTNDYIVTVTDQFSNCSNTDTVSIVANPLPPIDLGNDSTLCSNDPAAAFFLDATGAGLTYLWQDGSISPTYLVNSPGMYTVRVTDGNNCSNMDTVNVTLVNPAPVDINVNVVTSNTATLDAGPGFVSYLWYNFTTNQTINITGNGTYWVKVTDANGCMNSDTVSIVFMLDVENPDGSLMTISYYPNPSHGIVNFSVTGMKADRMELGIMDMSGRVIYTKVYESVTEVLLDQIDLSGMPNGTYLVRLQADDREYTNRIVINH